MVSADDSGDSSSSNNDRLDSDQLEPDVPLRKKHKVSTKHKRQTSAEKDSFHSKWLLVFPWIQYD